MSSNYRISLEWELNNLLEQANALGPAHRQAEEDFLKAEALVAIREKELRKAEIQCLSCKERFRGVHANLASIRQEIGEVEEELDMISSGANNLFH